MVFFFLFLVMTAILDVRPGCLVPPLVRLTFGPSTQNFIPLGPVVSEEKIFKDFTKYYTLSIILENWVNEKVLIKTCNICWMPRYLLSTFQIWTKTVKKWLSNGYLCVFAIYSNSGHLGCRAGSPGTNFGLPHLGTFHTKFGSNWPSGFRGEDFQRID